MKKLIQSLRNGMAENFRSLLISLLIGLGVTGSIALQDSYLVKTPLLPLGNFSWETNRDSSLQRQVLDFWSKSRDTTVVLKGKVLTRVAKDGLSVALHQNNADYGFIFFY